jgi:hypothetical protein
VTGKIVETDTVTATADDHVRPTTEAIDEVKETPMPTLQAEITVIVSARIDTRAAVKDGAANVVVIAASVVIAVLNVVLNVVLSAVLNVVLSEVVNVAANVNGTAIEDHPAETLDATTMSDPAGENETLTMTAAAEVEAEAEAETAVRIDSRRIKNVAAPVHPQRSENQPQTLRISYLSSTASVA